MGTSFLHPSIVDCPLRRGQSVRLAVLVALAGLCCLAGGRRRPVPVIWETLPLLPFAYGVSAGGGLATEGEYIYAADFSVAAGWDSLGLGASSTGAWTSVWEKPEVGAPLVLAGADLSALTLDDDGAGVLALPVALPDLAPAGLRAPPSAVVGGRLPVFWTTTNLGDGTPSGGWREAVFLSTDGILDAADLLLGEAAVADGTPAPGTGAERRLLAELPGALAAGDYSLIVVVDPDEQLAEADDSNNRALAVLCLEAPASGLPESPSRALDLFPNELSTMPGWVTPGLGDVDGDGLPDLISPAVVYRDKSSTYGIEVLYGQSEGSFGRSTFWALAAEHFPQIIRAGDVDGDSRCDLVTNVSRSLFVLRGQGDGTFSETALPHNEFVTELTLGDVDGDGHRDIVAWYDGTGVITVYVGDGAGEFPVVRTVTGSKSLMTVGQPEADGRVPLLTLDAATRTVGVFRLEAEGSFALQSFVFPGTTPVALACGDLDGDGLSDLVLGDQQGLLAVYLALAPGSLGPPTVYAAGHRVLGLILLDLDGDGLLDLSSLDANGASTSLWRNLGGGRFAPAATGDSLVRNGDFERPDLADASTLYGVPPADFAWAVPNGNVQHVNNLWSGVSGTPNADGLDQSVCLLAGPGTITQAVATTPGCLYELSFAYAHDPAWAAARGEIYVVDTSAGGSATLLDVQLTHDDGAATPADLRFRRFAALVTAPGDQTDIRLFNRANGFVIDDLRFRAVPAGRFETRLTLGGGLNARQFADLTGDGRPEAVLSGSYVYTVLRNRGDGALAGVPLLGTGQAPVGVAVGDLDHQGDLDLVAAASEGNRVAVLLSDGAGVYARRTYAVGSLPRAVAVADLNADGWADILVTDQNSHRLGVLLALGNGQFAAEATYAAGTTAVGLAVGRVNGDAIPDAVVANAGSGNVSVFLGNGDGTFPPALSQPVGAGPWALGIGDLDGDALADLVAANYSGASFTVLLGHGDGTFAAQPEVSLGAGRNPMGLALGDLDGDGRLDLALGLSQVNRIAVYRGQGDGTFAFACDLATPTQGFAAQMAIGDFSGDGRLDIASANTGDNSLTVFAGDGNGAFVRGPRIAAKTPTSLAAADVDGDGALDLVSGNWYVGWGNAYVGDDLSVYLNLRRAWAEPSGELTGSVDRVRFHFPVDMDTAAFTLATGVLSFTGPGGALSATGFTWIDARTLEITFAAQTALGVYRLVLSPALLTEAGSALGQTVSAGFTLVPPRVSGEVDDMTLWEGQVLMDGDVTVPAGRTLVLAPGTVVKVAGRHTALIVEGELVALGTAAAPVVITSAHDDLGGALAGSSGDPQPGDWEQIRVQNGGSAWLEQTRLRWGGEAGETASGGTLGGMLRVTGGSRAVLTACVLEHALYEGVLLWDAGTEVTLTSTVVRDCDTGVLADWSTGVSLTNCTLDDNRLGINGHGGHVVLCNSILSNSLEAGLDRTQAISTLDIGYCNVWSTHGANYRNWPDQTGLNGNLSVDPLYRVPAAGVPVLDYGSPMIDAADGSAAPASDFYDQRRYDDPRVGNTGTPTATGAYADLGACEFVENAPSDVDLAVGDVQGPSAVTAGEWVTIIWTVTNLGIAPVTGPWHDTIWLGSDRTAPVLVAEAGAPLGLAPGESVNLRATVRVPATLDLPHFWEVHTNSLSEVFEGRNTANNSARGASVVTVTVPVVTPDGAAVSVTFGAAGDRFWFRLDPASGDEDLEIGLVGSAGNRIRIYAKCADPPTPDLFAVASVPTVGANPTLYLSQPMGTLYLLLLAETLPAGPTDYTLRVTTAGLVLTDATPVQVHNAGDVTLKLQGRRLRETAVYELVAPDGGTRAATRVVALGGTEVLATFGLAGAAPGAYAVRASDGPSSDRLTDALVVVPASGTAASPPITVALAAAANVRAGRQCLVTLTYTNSGEADLPLPMLTVTASQGEWRYLPDGTQGRAELTLLAPPVYPRLPVLPAGASGTVNLFYTAPPVGASIEFSVYVGDFSDPGFAGQLLDWGEIDAGTRPEGVGDADWAAYVEQERTRYGETFDDLRRFLVTLIESMPEGMEHGTFVEGQWLWQSFAVTPGMPVDQDPFVLADFDAAVAAWPPERGPTGPEPGPRATFPRTTGDGIQNVHVLTLSQSGSGLANVAKDGQRAAQLFRSLYNVPNDNIGELTTNSKAEVLDSVQATVARADADDIVIIWNNSHGLKQTLSDAKPRGKLAYGQGIRPDEMDVALSGTRSQVLFVNDSCYSEAFNRAITNPKVMTVASAAWCQTAVDGSFSPTFAQKILRNPDGNILDAVAASRTQVRDLKMLYYSPPGAIPVDYAHSYTWQDTQNHLFETLPDLQPSILAAQARFCKQQDPVLDGKGQTSLRIQRPDAKKEATEQLKDVSQLGPPGDNAQTRSLSSFDPNEKLGPPPFVPGAASLPFTVCFENDPEQAQVPAQEVVITDALSANLDWTTFEPVAVGISHIVISIPPGHPDFTTTATVSTDPHVVEVRVMLDRDTGIVTWRLRSMAETPSGLPADPFAGFLPPNANPPEGEGWVSYTVRPRNDLADGTVITGAAARIVFDVNPAIETNTTTHTIDITPPVTTACVVRKTGDGSDLRVQISAADGPCGAGVEFVDVFVGAAAPGSAPTARAVDGTAVFAAAWGSTHDLYVRAIDGVGNAEPIPAEPSATVRVPQWAFRFGVTGGATDELFIGLDSSAGEGWDAGLDEDASGAAGAVQVALAGPAGHERLRYDVRAPAAAVRWTLLLGEPGGCRGLPIGPVTLVWDPESIPAGRTLWLVRLDGTGTPEPVTVVDASTADRLQISDSGQWQVVLSQAVELTLRLRRGWNALSLPVQPASPRVAELFGGLAAGSIAWGWCHASGGNGPAGFCPRLAVNAGEGFMVFAPRSGEVPINGVVPAGNPVTLQPGWNCIGVAATCRLPDDPRLVARAFVWQSTPPHVLQAVTTLEPWQAYWLYWLGETADALEFPVVPSQ